MTLRQQNPEIYHAWKAMKQRCQNPKNEAYKNYGGRGIKVCDEWQRFEPFCKWALSSGHKKGLELDRENNDGDYNAENCRWVTRRENTNNRRVTVNLEINGVIKCETEWADEAGIPKTTIKNWRRKYGVKGTIERIKRALTDGYKGRDYSWHSKKRVRCENDGCIYTSIKEAARQNNLSPGTLSKFIKEGKKYKGFAFTYYKV